MAESSDDSDDRRVVSPDNPESLESDKKRKKKRRKHDDRPTLSLSREKAESSGDESEEDVKRSHRKKQRKQSKKKKRGDDSDDDEEKRERKRIKKEEKKKNKKARRKEEKRRLQNEAAKEEKRKAGKDKAKEVKEDLEFEKAKRRMDLGGPEEDIPMLDFGNNVQQSSGPTALQQSRVQVAESGSAPTSATAATGKATGIVHAVPAAASNANASEPQLAAPSRDIPPPLLNRVGVAKSGSESTEAVSEAATGIARKTIHTDARGKSSSNVRAVRPPLVSDQDTPPPQPKRVEEAPPVYAQTAAATTTEKVKSITITEKRILTEEALPGNAKSMQLHRDTTASAPSKTLPESVIVPPASTQAVARGPSAPTKSERSASRGAASVVIKAVAAASLLQQGGAADQAAHFSPPTAGGNALTAFGQQRTTADNSRGTFEMGKFSSSQSRVLIAFAPTFGQIFFYY